MKRFLPILAAVAGFGTLLLSLFGATNAVYISQAGGGAGTSCGSPKDPSYFNSSGNWSGSPTGIQIGPDTTVHICGTITTILTFQGSGTSGHVVTLLAESGAILTQPAGTLINLNGQHDIQLNGGTNGIIQNTANGVNLANQVNVQAVQASGASNIEMENWTCSNIYVAAPPNAAPGIDDTLNNCIYSNGVGGSISIHNNTMHDAGWLINLGGLANGSVVQIYSNIFNNMDHAIVAGDGSNSYQVTIHDNQFQNYNNWDTMFDTYHHDGIHIYNGSGGPGNWGNDLYTIYNNLFSGNRGVNFTADIFTENSNNTQGQPQIIYYGNVHIQFPGQWISNGFFQSTNGTLLGSLQMYDNVYVADPTVVSPGDQSCVRTGAVSIAIKNNVFSGCTNFLSIESGSAASSGIDYNVYAQQGNGGDFRWNWEAIGGTNSIATWRGQCGCDTHSTYVTSAQITGNGQPQPGSPLLLFGVNLTSLGFTALNAGTTAGTTVTPSAQPSMGAWTAGAYGAGSSAAPIVSLSPPSTLAFSNVNTGANASLTETLTNAGSATLTGSIAITTGTYFSITGGTCSAGSLSVAAGASCTVIVRFAPLVAAMETDALVFTTNASSSPNTITLTGTGVASVPVVSFSAGTLGFGNVADGSNTALTETLTNTGSATLTGTIAVGTGTYYTITGGTCSTGSLSLSSSSSCTVIVQYAPTMVRAVAVDAVGPSSSGAGCLFPNPWTGPVTCTWSHTIASGANPLIVGVSTNIHNDAGITTTATFDGIPMISIPGSVVHANSFTVGYIQEFELINPPSGTHNVIVSVHGSSTTDRLSIIGGSLSFTGSYGPTVLNSATGLSQTISLTATGGTSSGLFVALGAGGSAISVPTQTSRWLNNFNLDAGAGNAGMQTAIAGINANFGYTIASMPDYWAILTTLIAPGDGDTLVFTTNASTSPDTVFLTGTGTGSTAAPTNLQIFELQ